jgi:hypothetical protein
MGFKEWEFEMNNANKGESKGKCTLLVVGDCQRYLGLRTNTNNGENI